MSNLTMINLEVGSWMQLTFISKLLSKKPVFKEGFLVLCRFSCDSCDTSLRDVLPLFFSFLMSRPSNLNDRHHRRMEDTEPAFPQTKREPR